MNTLQIRDSSKHKNKTFAPKAHAFGAFFGIAMTSQLDRRNAVTHGVLWKELLKFFFPVLIGNVFQQVYNVVDSIIVGRFIGKEALSAIGGSCSVIISLFIFLFVGVSVGCTVVVANSYGAKDYDKVKRAMHTAVAIATLVGVGLCVAGILTSRWSLETLNTAPDILEPGLIYLKIYFIGMIPGCIYNMNAGLLRGLGDSKKPFYFIIVSCVTNIILDLLFVAVLDYGIAGAAWATNIAQLVSAVLSTVVLMRIKADHRLVLGHIRVHGKEAREILKVGVPSALNSCMYTLTNLIIQAKVNTFPTAMIAGLAIEGKVDGIGYMIATSFAATLVTFVGQNYGAGNMKRATQSVRYCLCFCFASILVFSSMVMIFRYQIAGLFSTDNEVIEATVMVFWVIMPLVFLATPMDIFSGAMRGYGRAGGPLVASVIGVMGFRIFWIAVVMKKYNSFMVLVASWPISWGVCSILMMTMYLIVKHQVKKKMPSQISDALD